MKTKSLLIAIFSFLLVGGMFAKNEKVIFKVEMDCQACKQKIEKNIAFERGVKGLEVELEKDLVTVTYNPAKTDIAKLQEGFKKIDFVAVELKTKECCAEKAKADTKQTCPDDKQTKAASENKACDSKTKTEKN